MLNIAVIIPVFNGINYTRKCLKNLLELRKESGFTDESFRIVIVDDGSRDGTGEIIPSEFPEINLLKGNGNLWWSGGVRMGAKHAVEVLQSDYIVLWNNDILADSGYFRNLNKILNKSSQKHILGSKILRLHEPDIIWSHGATFNPVTGAKHNIGMDKKDSSEYDRIVESDWLPGMGTIIPKEVFLTIGYWNAEDFPQYHGDAEFTWRARKAGFEIFSYPELRIFNDTTNTGIKHNGSFKLFRKALVDIKSNYNIKKDLLFLKYFADSPLAYWPVFKKYFRFTGGFLKWKILGIFNIEKKSIYQIS